jgi:hypothetical protein
MTVINDLRPVPRRIFHCCCCGRQAVPRATDPRDAHVTTLQGARAGFSSNEVFCGHCAVDLDENGLFPEEREYV